MESRGKTLMQGGLRSQFASVVVHCDWVHQNFEEMKLSFKHQINPKTNSWRHLALHNSQVLTYKTDLWKRNHKMAFLLTRNLCDICAAAISPFRLKTLWEQDKKSMTDPHYCQWVKRIFRSKKRQPQSQFIPNVLHICFWTGIRQVFWSDKKILCDHEETAAGFSAGAKQNGTTDISWRYEDLHQLRTWHCIWSSEDMVWCS